MLLQGVYSMLSAGNSISEPQCSAKSWISLFNQSNLLFSPPGFNLLFAINGSVHIVK